MTQQRIQELLQELHALTQPSLPAHIFSGPHTPLQAAVLHLSKTHTTKELSRLLLRPKSVIDNALTTARKKGALPESTGHLIPISALQDLTLTPGEALVYALRHLPNKEIAQELGKDPRNTWTLLKRTQQKLEGEQ